MNENIFFQFLAFFLFSIYFTVVGVYFMWAFLILQSEKQICHIFSLFTFCYWIEPHLMKLRLLQGALVVGTMNETEADQVVAGLMLMLINYTTAFKLKSSDDNSNEFNWKTVFRRTSRFAYKSVNRGAGSSLHRISMLKGAVGVGDCQARLFPRQPIQKTQSNVQGRIAAS